MATVAIIINERGLAWAVDKVISTTILFKTVIPLRI